MADQSNETQQTEQTEQQENGLPIADRITALEAVAGELTQINERLKARVAHLEIALTGAASE